MYFKPEYGELSFLPSENEMLIKMILSVVCLVEESVLARASFEMPMKHLVDASVRGESDELRSVIENVIVNQPVPNGTGLPVLVSKEHKKVKKENKK